MKKEDNQLVVSDKPKKKTDAQPKGRFGAIGPVEQKREAGTSLGSATSNTQNKQKSKFNSAFNAIKINKQKYEKRFEKEQKRREHEKLMGRIKLVAVICIILLLFSLLRSCGSDTSELNSPVDPGSIEEQGDMSQIENQEASEQVEDAHEHTYDTVSVKVKCDKAGFTVYQCKCGFRYISDIVKSPGHNFIEIETKDNKKRFCDNCDFVDYDIDVVPEQPTETEQPAAPEQSVEQQADNKEEVEKPAYITQNTTTSKPKEDTSNKNNSTQNKNNTTTNKPDTSNKKEEVKVEEPVKKEPTKPQPSTPAHTHSYTKKTVAATCTKEGYTIYSCSCGDSYTGNKTSKIAHSYKDTITKPTCAKDGYTSHTCSMCGDTYKDNTVKATGHDYTTLSKTVKSTMKNSGSRTYKCSCGDTYKITIPSDDQVWCEENGEFGYCKIQDASGESWHYHSEFKIDGYNVIFCTGVSSEYREGKKIFIPFPNYCPDTNGESVGTKHQHSHTTLQRGNYTYISCTWISEISVPSGNIQWYPAGYF